MLFLALKRKSCDIVCWHYDHSKDQG